MRKVIVLLSCLICGGIGGCRSFDGQQVRNEQAEIIPRESLEKTEALLSQFDSPLTLVDCVGLALQESLDLETAELQRRLAKLDKQASFSNFLPTVTLGAQKTYWDPQPMVNFNGTGIAMHDKKVRDVTWNIQWSLFNPATWFLYNMYSSGYEIAELSLDYTRQSLIFQVTTLYYQVLGLEQMHEVTQANLRAAQAQAKELEAMQREGMVPSWQADQAQTMVLARQLDSNQLQRTLREAKADLLVLLGLSPEADLELAMDLPLDISDRPLDDLMTEALLNHPSLAIADRQVEIAREKVKYAVSAFIPQLVGFAGRTDTTDSHQVFSNYWSGGFAATLTVFNGFANVADYKAAKVTREQAFIEREQATLALMVQVIRTYDQVQTAREQLELAQSYRQVAEGRLAETKRQHQQGMVQASDLLNQVAAADQARISVDSEPFSRANLYGLVEYRTGICPCDL